MKTRFRVVFRNLAEMGKISMETGYKSESGINVYILLFKINFI